VAFVEPSDSGALEAGVTEKLKEPEGGANDVIGLDVEEAGPNPAKPENLGAVG
jgi:hypothetical protein